MMPASKLVKLNMDVYNACFWELGNLLSLFRHGVMPCNVGPNLWIGQSYSWGIGTIDKIEIVSLSESESKSSVHHHHVVAQDQLYKIYSGSNMYILMENVLLIIHNLFKFSILVCLSLKNRCMFKTCMSLNRNDL